MIQHTIKQAGVFFNVLFFSLTLSAQGVKQLTILHTNDTHSRIEPTAKNAKYQDEADKGGYVRRATYLKEIRSDGVKNLLLLDCGDFSQGTPYYNMFRGEVEIRLMNEMKYDACAIGNHEFDFGLDNMARLFKMAQFPIVCSNYEVKGTVLEGLVKPYIIVERDGLKIGIFALSPRLAGLVQEDKYEGVVYKEPNDVANETAALLKREKGCNLVVCLSHLGMKASGDNPACDENLVANTRNIDIIIGGHSHTFMKKPAVFLNADGKDVYISQMGKNGIYVGRMDLIFNKK